MCPYDGKTELQISSPLSIPNSKQDTQPGGILGNLPKSVLQEEHAKAIYSNSSSGGEANAGWRDIETNLKNEIMLRHYSPKTFESYRLWVRKFRGFLFNRNPSLLVSSDVKTFLTDLAVRKRVSSSAQNQPFNALLFLFRHVLKKELSDMSDTPRAKRSKYVPTVLSK